MLDLRHNRAMMIIRGQSRQTVISTSTVDSKDGPNFGMPELAIISHVQPLSTDYCLGD